VNQTWIDWARTLSSTVDFMPGAQIVKGLKEDDAPGASALVFAEAPTFSGVQSVLFKSPYQGKHL